MKKNTIHGLCLIGLTLSSTTAAIASDSPYLFGDWNGERTKLEEKGVSLSLYHIFDVYDDVSGALESGTAYFGRQRVAVNVDLEKLFGLQNSQIGISGVDQYGKNYNRSRFGVLTNPSSIEGTETTRLANIWFSQQILDGHLSYKVGKVDGVGEFGLQEYSSSFMNDEFAYVPNAIFGAGLPFDPAQKLGVVITYTPGENGQGLYFKGGAFDSNDLDAYGDDHNGLSFDWQGPVAYAGEIGYRTSGSAQDKPAFIKFGGHYNTGDFTDLGNPLEEISDNYLLYLSAGKTIYNFDHDGQRHLDASLTWVYAPKDRNLYNNELSAIIRAIGPFEGRPTDELGLGLVAAFLSDDFSDASVAAGDAEVEEEYTVELTYKANVTPWLTLQPSLQAVMNPAGNTNRDTVYIAGFRTIITF